MDNKDFDQTFHEVERVSNKRKEIFEKLEKVNINSQDLTQVQESYSRIDVLVKKIGECDVGERFEPLSKMKEGKNQIIAIIEKYNVFPLENNG